MTGRRTAGMRADDPGTVWIRTTPAAHDTYRPVLEIDDDTAHDLGGGIAWKHAHAILAAVARAEHDAAIIRQLGDKTGHAVHLVAALRAERTPIDWPTPLTLDPGVSAATGEPFLHLRIRGALAGQWTPQDARGHALHVLEADAAATLDGAYFHALKAAGIDDAKARVIVDDLLNHREEGSS